jgi:predicted amidophosphoribosyltransferase
MIARGIAKALELRVVEDVVVRKRAVETQTRKGRYERWMNVQDAFEVINRGDLNGKHIILVDDVLTTGSTLEACATRLIDELGAKVSIVTLAKAELT